MSHNQLQSLLNPEASSPSKKQRSTPLTTIGHCRHELASVYRLGKSGNMTLSDMTKYCYVLVQLSKMIESGDVETRLTTLENKIGGGVR
jgi:Mg2+ and Co2+ transporter CorA